MKYTQSVFLTLILVILPFSLFAESPTVVSSSDDSSSSDSKELLIDTEKSVVKWIGKKITDAHNGTLRVSSGKVTIEDGKLQGGEFNLDMNTIENSDIESPKWKAKLENHLKSDDFFNIAKFSKSSFKITKATKTDNTHTQLDGILTIKGIALPLSFPATIEQSDNRYHAKAKVTLDRTKWDIRYNSGKWFDPAQLGDKLILDEIGVELDIVTAPITQ